jgi:hypothetical protein
MVKEYEDDRPDKAVTLDTFVYSQCWLNSICDFMGEIGGTGGLRAKMIAHVKEKGAATRWVTGGPLKGAVYTEDPVEELPRVTVAIGAQLRELGLCTVADVAAEEEFLLTTDNFKEIAASVDRMQRAGVAAIVAKAREAIPGTRPVAVNHLKHDNPYLSRYGDAGADRNHVAWEQVIDADLRKQGQMCVTHQVRHLVRVCKDGFVGTRWENDWYFFHDALPVMVCKQCQDWMESEGWLKHWILPQHGCNAGTRWAHSPLGDTPEIQGWDCHGNKRVDDSMKRHVTATRHLPSTGYNDDWELEEGGKNPHPDKFHRATPKQQDRGYLRILNDNISPTSEEHITDRDACFGSGSRRVRACEGWGTASTMVGGGRRWLTMRQSAEAGHR